MRIILIDNNSGYIWGDSADFGDSAFNGSPEEYAKALDESLGAFGRSYSMRSSNPCSDTTGYHAYRADIDGGEAIPVVLNGQCQETIDAVTEKCEYIGFISISEEQDD